MAGLGDYEKKAKGSRGYKMKPGSPFERNYNIGTPVKKKAGPEPNTEEINKLMNVDPFSDDEQAYERAQNDFNTSNPTKEQIAKSKAKMIKDGE